MDTAVKAEQLPPKMDKYPETINPPSYAEVIRQGETCYPPNMPISIISREKEYILQQDARQAKLRLGRKSKHFMCPSCGNAILTKIEYKSSGKTHAAAGVIFCCIFWPLAWIPYVLDVCKTANHFCPKCDAFIGQQ